MKFKNKKIIKQICIICLGAAVLYGILCIDGKEKSIEGGSINRPDYSESEKNIGVIVRVDGETETIVENLNIQPRQYNEQQTEELFEKIYEELPNIICNSNKDFDNVSENLNLVTELENYPVLIEWYSEDYSVIDYQGGVHIENLPENIEKQRVELQAVLTYGDYKSSRMYDVTVVKPTLYGAEKLNNEVNREVVKAEEQQREKDTVQLPDKINGKKVSYAYDKDRVSPWIAVFLGVVGIVAVIANEKHKKQQESEQRKSQLRYDYSEMVSKLTLLIGAGMTIRMAWFKIVDDYYKTAKEKRYVYEEMAETKRQIESGRSERNSYEKFGRRCDTKEYLKLGALLEQNIRKGTKDIIKMLEKESEDAFEEHKNLAVKKGEEAGTKLLIPMIIMLLIVMIIVMVPAIMSFNI